jgi:hypothetical protein
VVSLRLWQFSCRKERNVEWVLFVREVWCGDEGERLGFNGWEVEERETG